MIILKKAKSADNHIKIKFDSHVLQELENKQKLGLNYSHMVSSDSHIEISGYVVAN